MSQTGSWRFLCFRKNSRYSRRVASGGHCPSDFCFCPLIYFLPPPHGIFLGGKSCCFYPKKQFEFVISATKSLRISAKTLFFFLFLEITCFSPEKTFEFVISARKSLRIPAKTLFFFFFWRSPVFGRRKRLNL